MYSSGVKQFVEGKDAPKNVMATARGCYIATGIYGGLALFSVYQTFLNYRAAKFQRMPIVLGGDTSINLQD